MFPSYLEEPQIILLLCIFKVMVLIHNPQAVTFILSAPYTDCRHAIPIIQHQAVTQTSDILNNDYYFLV